MSVFLSTDNNNYNLQFILSYDLKWIICLMLFIRDFFGGSCIARLPVVNGESFVLMHNYERVPRLATCSCCLS